MTEYEYAAQWYPGSHDSWIRDEWHGNWTTLEKAKADFDLLIEQNKHRIPDQLRMVRRRKAGPVEVVI